MAVFHSLPAFLCLAFSLLLACLHRFGKAKKWTGPGSFLLSGALMVLTLTEGGSMHEALACLLPPLCLLLPREARHEL